MDAVGPLHTCGSCLHIRWGLWGATPTPCIRRGRQRVQLRAQLQPWHDSRLLNPRAGPLTQVVGRCRFQPVCDGCALQHMARGTWLCLLYQAGPAPRQQGGRGAHVLNPRAVGLNKDGRAPVDAISSGARCPYQLGWLSLSTPHVPDAAVRTICCAMWYRAVA